MVHGPEVALKYHAIVAGRQQELYQGKSHEQCVALQDEVLAFADEVRQCNREDFNAWYELYKDSVYIPPRRKKGIEK